MAEMRAKTGTLANDDPRGAQLVQRLDRIAIWPFSPLALWIIALGFMFTFYDIYVSFVQTCVQLQPGCTLTRAFRVLTSLLMWNLGGYMLGAIGLGPLCDRFGRRNMLLVTMLIAGLGSAYTAVSQDMLNFTLSRAITGIGTGADLAVVSTYLSEVAPRTRRARYNVWIFVAANAGAAPGSWLGLILPTRPARWPVGPPIAQAGPSFPDGWRCMYWIGGILAIVATLLRLEMPQSPRWLVSRGRLEHAGRLVEHAEARTRRKNIPLLPTPAAPSMPGVTPPATYGQRGERWGAYAHIFGNRTYQRRALILAMWIAAYISIYSLAVGMSSLLVTLRYPQIEAGLITAVGVVGLFIARLSTPLSNRVPRRPWLPATTTAMIIGAVVLMVGGAHFLPLAFLGAALMFIGNSLATPIAYAWSAEQFPTRSRTTGFGLVERHRPLRRRDRGAADRTAGVAGRRAAWPAHRGRIRGSGCFDCAA